MNSKSKLVKLSNFEKHSPNFSDPSVEITLSSSRPLLKHNKYEFIFCYKKEIIF